MLKLGSVIDYIRDSLDKDIFVVDGKEVKLQPHVADQILDVCYSMTDDLELPDEAIKDVFIYGSILTNSYNPKTDVDARIVLQPTITYERFGKEITGDDLYNLVIEQVHGIPIGHTKHPLNCTIVIEGEDTELGRSELGKTEDDPVYDVLNDKIVVAPVYKEDYDPDEEFAEEREEADVIMGTLDDMLRDLKTSVIDYDWLEDAVKDVKDKDKLIAKLESKLEDIENEVALLVEEYGAIKDMRTEEYGEEGERHKGKGNVIFKINEKYQYLDVLRKLKRIFKGGVTEKEVEDVAETLNIQAQSFGGYSEEDIDMWDRELEEHEQEEKSKQKEDLYRGEVEKIYELTYKYQMLSQEAQIGDYGAPQVLPDNAYIEVEKIKAELEGRLNDAYYALINVYDAWISGHEAEVEAEEVGEGAVVELKSVYDSLINEWEYSNLGDKIILFQLALQTAHNNGPMAEYLVVGKGSITFLNSLSEGTKVPEWDRDLQRLLGYSPGSRLQPKLEYFETLNVAGGLNRTIKYLSNVF